MNHANPCPGSNSSPLLVRKGSICPIYTCTYCKVEFLQHRLRDGKSPSHMPGHCEHGTLKGELCSGCDGTPESLPLPFEEVELVGQVENWNSMSRADVTEMFMQMASKLEAYPYCKQTPVEREFERFVSERVSKGNSAQSAIIPTRLHRDDLASHVSQRVEWKYGGDGTLLPRPRGFASQYMCEPAPGSAARTAFAEHRISDGQLLWPKEVVPSTHGRAYWLGPDVGVAGVLLPGGGARGLPVSIDSGPASTRDGRVTIEAQDAGDDGRDVTVRATMERREDGVHLLDFETTPGRQARGASQRRTVQRRFEGVDLGSGNGDMSALVTVDSRDGKVSATLDLSVLPPARIDVLGQFREAAAPDAPCFHQPPPGTPLETVSGWTPVRQPHDGTGGIFSIRVPRWRVGEPPVPMYLRCPQCLAHHVDQRSCAPGTVITETHLCFFCGHCWRPMPFPTAGVPAPSSGPYPFARPKASIRAAILGALVAQALLARGAR